jgi:hypothetical protein
MPELPALFCSLFSVIWSLEPGASRQGKAPWRSHTHARIRPRRTWPDPLHGFTTRFTMSENREQRTENRPDDRPFVPSANSKRQASEAGDRPSRFPTVSWARSDDLENQDPPATVGPLSSVPCRRIFACLVGLGRLERPTSRLSGVRSNQLSYRPSQTTEDCRLSSVLCRLSWKGCVDGGQGPRSSQMSSPDASCQNARALSVICPLTSALRKEVIQPQVPLRLPCYDFTPVADLTVDGYPPSPKTRVGAPA